MINIPPDYQEATDPAVSFFEIITEYSECYKPDTFPPRHIQPSSGLAFPWIMISYETVSLPEQGWKLHLAACEASAEQILRRVLPRLLSESVPFKVLNSLNDLAILNSGQAGLSQIGKFLTVYPRTDDEAVRLAAALDLATEGLPAPAIPSDRPLRSGSLVFYRYGGFQSQVIQTAWGEVQLALQTPDQTLVPDVRTSSYRPPDWVIDPFLAAGVAQELPLRGQLLADRYLLLTTLYQSAQSQIQLAVDLQASRRCVIKQPGLGFIRGRNESEDLTSQRLRHEAQVLAALAPHRGFPVCYDLHEEQDKVLLVLEDVEGETLASHMQGRHLLHERIIAWGQELVALLDVLHTQGWAHCDLKASNVIVTPEGHLCLIDFGTVQALESKRAAGAGTQGYMSPQQLRGEPVSVSDDIYGLGALLYLMATGAEPSFAPRDKALTARPLRLLNPALDASLAAVIERCLASNPDKRFTSVRELGSALAELSTPSSNAPFLSEQAHQQSPMLTHTPEDYRQFAQRLCNTLSQTAQPDPHGHGRRWTSTHYMGKGIQGRDLNTGNSGSLLAFAELVDEFGDTGQRDILAECAHWLTVAPRSLGTPLPGLHVGEAGVSIALWRAGQVLNDAMLQDEAIKRSRWIATQPFASPDLFNGTAGRIRFHLWLWDATADAHQLQVAVQAGEALLAAAESVRPGEVCWRIPAGYGGMSELAYLGYAHGAAGIADVLLDLYEASQQERFLSLSLAAGSWLQRQAMPVLSDESGLDWPAIEGGQPRGAFWCHGATGIGGFFLHAAQLEVLPGAMEIAERAARTVFNNRACGPVQCHGLAGNIEFLLDMAQITGKQQYRLEAFELAELLAAFAVEKDGLLMWSSESPITCTPDYQVGFAGIAMTLLRLGDPQRPRQLSYRGYGHSSFHMPS